MLPWWPWKRSSWRGEAWINWWGVCNAVAIALKVHLVSSCCKKIFCMSLRMLFPTIKCHWRGPLCVTRANRPAAWFWICQSRPHQCLFRVFVRITLTLDDVTLFHSIWMRLACVPADRIVFKGVYAVIKNVVVYWHFYAVFLAAEFIDEAPWWIFFFF